MDFSIPLPPKICNILFCSRPKLTFVPFCQKPKACRKRSALIKVPVQILSRSSVYRQFFFFNFHINNTSDLQLQTSVCCYYQIIIFYGSPRVISFSHFLCTFQYLPSRIRTQQILKLPVPWDCRPLPWFKRFKHQKLVNRIL